MAYKSFPFFAFRTPILPMNKQFSEIDMNTLLNQFSNPHIQEAIYLASPILYDEIHKLLLSKIQNNKEIDRILYSFWRYISRMHTRCTPFGLFAGCGLGELGKDTVINLQNTIKRKTRLDMFFLCTLYDSVFKMPDIKENVNYYPNSSLYMLGNKYRYVESLYLNSRLKYQISEVERSFYLKKVLKISSQGAKIEKLVNELVNETISREEALDFLHELIDSQVLIGELNNAITGDDFFNRMICLIETVNKNNQILPLLKTIKHELEKSDLEKNGVDSYKHIISLIKNIDVPFEENFLFQVDLHREATIASLGDKVIEELKSSMAFLNRINFVSKNDTLDKFRQDFYNRYEEKEIPLMEALDSELGLGYPSKSKDGDPSPLVEDFSLPQKEEVNPFFSNKFHTMLYEKAFDCLSQNKKELVLTDDDIKDFDLNWNDMPATMYTVFEIIRANPNNILIKLDFFTGNGARLLARFAHVDEKMDIFIREITLKEQSLTPNAVLAEIVHLPEARVGNVLFRPHIREYEIVYLASSDISHEKQINVSDLMLSVRNSKLIIRSKRLGKEIIPQLSTAHVYHHGLHVYRFLCDVQIQSVKKNALSINWGAYNHYFRPRVRYKNTIFSPATWFIEQNKIKYLFMIQEDDELIFEIEKWRDINKMPRWVQMVESDNKLWVDWQNTLNIRSLFSIIKNKPFVTFTEFLFEPENAVVKDGDGNVYQNECIAVFYRNSK